MLQFHFVHHKSQASTTYFRGDNGLVIYFGLGKIKKVNFTLQRGWGGGVMVEGVGVFFL
jgi:hypothetical protein